MAIQLQDVTVEGIGSGSIPHSFKIRGKVVGCETISLNTPCSPDTAIIPIPTGGENEWSTIIPNINQCKCGDTIKIIAWCGLGQPGADSITLDLKIKCCCPRLVLDSPIVVTGCIPGSVSVAFNTTIHWSEECPRGVITHYLWTINIGGVTYQKVTQAGSVTTENTLWTNLTTQSQQVPLFSTPGTYSVAATAFLANPPGVADCHLQDTLPFPVKDCCPSLTGIQMQVSPSNACRWIFSAQVDNPDNRSVSFQWRVKDSRGDRILMGQTSSIAEDLFTPSSGQVEVEVTLISIGCTDKTLTIPFVPNCIPVFPPEDVDTEIITTPGPKPQAGGPSFFCYLLLALAMLVLVSGSVGLMFSICAADTTGIFISSFVGLGGMGLLALWGFLCARNMCSVLNALAWIVSFISAGQGVAAFIAQIVVANCLAGALITDAAVWGLILSIIAWISSFTKCTIFRQPIF